MILYLQDMRGKEERLQEKKRELYGKIETLEEAIERNTFAKRENEDDILTGGSYDKDKLYRILMLAYKDIDDELEYTAGQLLDLFEQEEKLKKMWRCIDRLPPRQAEVIEALCIDGVRWLDYARVVCQSRASVGRVRKKAIENLLSLYNEAEAHGKKREVTG